MNSPKHVAIIMDGNGRWGIKKNKSRNFGHTAGVKTVEKIIEEAVKNKMVFYFSRTESDQSIKERVNFGETNRNRHTTSAPGKILTVNFINEFGLRKLTYWELVLGCVQD